MKSIEMLEQKLEELYNASYGEELRKLYEVAEWAKQAVNEAKNE